MSDFQNIEVEARSAGWKPKIFISYSPRDKRHRERLETELKVLANLGLLERVWSDRMIDPGEKWDNVIRRELMEADVFIILVSLASLTSNYIIEREIPMAMELQSRAQLVIVPVILEPCNWQKTELGELLALPEGARPVNSWKPRNNAWGSISDGLRRVFLQLIQAKRPQESRDAPATETPSSSLDELLPLWPNDAGQAFL